MRLGGIIVSASIPEKHETKTDYQIKINDNDRGGTNG